MKLKQLQEGRIKVWIPIEKTYEADVFYNPEAELNRDISISALQVFQKEFKSKLNVLDALSATGVRGLRYAKEVSGIKSIVLNDRDGKAFNLVKRNIKENKLQKKCFPKNVDANLLMRQNVFNVIDLDPFGSPNIFMDSAARSVYHKGFLSVTATDTAPLCGTYPEACLKKYGIKSMKTEFYNELGIRILLSFIILTLARYDRAFIPLLSLSTKHYFRVFGRIEHSGKIENLLKNFGYVNYCVKCGERKIGDMEKFHIVDRKNHIFRNCGLIYLGKINDKKYCKKVLQDLKKRDFRNKKQEEKILKLLIEESDLPPFYFDLHYLGKNFKIPIPKIESLTSKLKARKFLAGRTHFSLTAIKTDASLEDLKKSISQ